MAAFLRLMRLVSLAVLCVLFAVVSYASGTVPASSAGVVEYSNGEIGSAQQLCDDWAAPVAAANPQAGVHGVVTNADNQSMTCQVHQECAPGYCGCSTSYCGDIVSASATWPAIVEPGCPSNSGPTGGGASTCTCSTGYVPDQPDASCVSVCGAAGSANTELGSGSFAVTGNLNNLCSPAGCSISASVTATSQGSGDQFAVGPFQNTGGTCNPTASNTPTQAAGQSGCSGADMCGGTVNGTFVCAKCGSASSAPVSSSTSTTDTPAPGAAGSSSTSTVSTSTSTTDNANGTSTTTTTTTHGDGSTTSTSTTCVTATKGCTGATDDDQKDSFGGSCGGTFTCDGDAIQCAIAQDQHIRSCEMFEPSTAGGIWASGAQTLTTAMSDGDVPSWSPSSPANLVATSFDWATSIDQSSSLASSCPSDVAVGDSGLVLSLSSLCPYLGVLGTFAVAMTSIACAFVLLKGVK